jgi:hypothetical protein
LRQVTTPFQTRNLSQETHQNFYDNTQILRSFNWIEKLTAEFEEFWAFSVLAGNVVNYYFVDRKGTKGLGYSGYLFSVGNYHIRDNAQIRDEWKEFEWKRQ